MKVLALSFIAACVASQVSGATLSYTGNPFVTTTVGAGNVNITLSFDGPLSLGRTIVASEFLSWSFSSVGRSITQDDNPSSFDLQLRIGDDGLPDAWLLYAEKNIEGGALPEQWTSRANSRVFGFPAAALDAFAIDDENPNNFRSDGTAFSSIFNAPGTWAVTVAPVPLPPAVLSLGLAVAGLGALGWYGRSRQARVV